MAQAVSALAIIVIETAFLRLLMTTVGDAMPDPAGEFTAGVTAIDLSPLTMRTDVEDDTATRGLTGALTERSMMVIKHVRSRSGWTAETEGGKMQCKYNLCFGNGVSKV